MKKLLKKMLAAATMLSMILTASVCRAQVISYDVAVGELSVQQEATAETGRFAYVVILPLEVKRDSITAEQITNDMLFDVIEKEDAKFESDYELGSSMSLGEYVVYLETDGGTQTKLFINCDMQELSSLVSALNSGAEMPSTVSFGANNTIYSQNVQNMTALIQNQKDGSYTNETFLSSYLRAEGISRVKNGQIDGDEFFLLYFSEYGISADAFPVDEAEYRNLFETVISRVAIGNRTSGEILEDALWLTAVRQCESGGELEALMTQYMEEKTLSTGKYELLNSYYQKETMTELYKVSTSYQTMSELYEKFLLLAENCYNDVNSSNNGSGGPGGSSGSSGSSGSGSSGGGRWVEVPVETENVEAEPNSMFSDVQTHWGKLYIEELCAKGILTGYDDNTFRPDSFVTRAEMSAILCRALELTPVAESVFLDVSLESWYGGMVGAVNQIGIVLGDGENFYPEHQISRQDAAVMIDRMLRYRQVSLSGEAEFSDVALIGEYAKSSVGALASSGIVTGDDGKFRPLDGITRAEAAAIVSRALRVIDLS